ncbi:flagellar hook-length control protein FliK [Pollutimonas bauzanensis]|uniref:flagellar hook-length control protein FliK n=1 Tax=Pollutimonas bauzanensis TaxID=658167 RepID=UPI003340A10A
MTTLTIPAALPVAPGNTSRPPSDAATETDASGPSFSSVLSNEQSNRSAVKTAVTANGGSHTGAKKDQLDAAPEAGKDAADEAPAQSADEQGLGLPHIALTIAAEAALAMAGRQAAPAGTAQSKASPTAAGLAPGELHAVLVDNAKADPAQADSTRTSPQKATLALPQTTLPALEARITAHNDKPVELPAGFTPARVAPTAPHQTELDARKPINPTNIKPVLAQDRTRTGDSSLGKGSTPDITASLAAMATKTAAFTIAQHDQSIPQAGAVITGGASGVQAPLLSGNGGPTPGTAVQFAMPGIATPLQSQQWPADFARQFISLAKGGHNMPHTAELRLDPPELGPLRISININDNVAHAIFTSPHAAVRQTVENSLPQLQQMLAQAGISLGQTSVNDQGQQESTFNESFGSGRKPAMTAAASSSGGIDTTPQTATRSRTPDALVDTFA